MRIDLTGTLKRKNIKYIIQHSDKLRHVIQRTNPEIMIKLDNENYEIFALYDFYEILTNEEKSKIIEINKKFNSSYRKEFTNFKMINLKNCDD